MVATPLVYRGNRAKLARNSAKKTKRMFTVNPVATIRRLRPGKAYNISVKPVHKRSGGQSPLTITLADAFRTGAYVLFHFIFVPYIAFLLTY